jgi:putative SOS response-associated peptidase YedK
MTTARRSCRTGGRQSVVCGRYASMRDTADLVLLTGAIDETREPDPADASRSREKPAGDADPVVKDPLLSANIAPTDRARVLLEAEGRRVIRRHSWGLIPPWAKGPQGAARMINARIETVADKPSYRRAIRTARCLLPADGWYEWRVSPDGRRPYLVSRADGEPLWLAGVWARWHPPGGGPALASAAVLTGPAPPQLEWLHERAPLVVPDAFRSRWLAADGSEPQPILDTLASIGYPALSWHAVSREIGQVRVKDARLMLPVPEEEPTPALF